MGGHQGRKVPWPLKVPNLISITLIIKNKTAAEYLLDAFLFEKIIRTTKATGKIYLWKY